jgi:hypothetical protein
VIGTAARRVVAVKVAFTKIAESHIGNETIVPDISLRFMCSISSAAQGEFLLCAETGNLDVHAVRRRNRSTPHHTIAGAERFTVEGKTSRSC